MWRLTKNLKESGPDRGATAVLMGLLITGLVGFTGLAVDGAATMAKQQELQNGADAAALAAAAECGNDGCAGIEAAAGPYGGDNVSNHDLPVSTTFSVDSGAQEVTATVAQEKAHWFLPVVGVNSSSLDADATASWGRPTRGPAMFPIAISTCAFGAALEVGVIKEVYMPKGGLPEDGCAWNTTYPSGSFGWLTADCDDLPEIIIGEPTDTDPGVDTPSCDWDSYVGQTVLIPLFNEVLPDPPPPKSTKPVMVEKFAAFRLDGIRYDNANWAQAGSACSYSSPGFVNATMHRICVKGEFIEYVTYVDDYENDDEDSEVTVVRLVG